MCLNDLLHDEQLALMRFASATDPVQIREHRRKLSGLRSLLAAHPYPHRPFHGRGAR